MDSVPKKIIRSIWNGPFHIGELASPVSVGDVLLKVLEATWRVLVSILVLALVGFGISAFWVTAIEPTFFPPLKSKIEIAVRYDDGTAPQLISVAPPGSSSDPAQSTVRCNADFPYAVRFTNRSGVAIGKISFEIEAYRKGYAGPVSDQGSYLISTAVIKPGYWFEGCWTGPALPDSIAGTDLIYRANVFDAEEVDPVLADSLAPAIAEPHPAAPAIINQRRPPSWATLAVAIFALMTFALGSFGLLGILRVFAPASIEHWINKHEGGVIIACVAIHFATLLLLTAVFRHVGPVADSIDALDLWSRSNGHADAAMVVIFALASLWTLPALWPLGSRRKSPAAPTK